MSQGEQGGQWALAGFLYQILGSLSLVAQAEQIQDGEEGDDSDPLGKLLLLVRQGDAEPEAGEDLLVTAPVAQDVAGETLTAALVQYKSTQSGDKLEKPDLVGIARNMARAWTNQGLTGNVGCYLVTNRELTKPAEELLQTVSAAGFRRSDLRLAPKGKREAVTDAVLQRRQEVLRQLKIVPEELCQHEEKLRTFARRHGVLEVELNDGLDRLVGRYIRRVGNQWNILGTEWRISGAELREAFVDYRDARELTPEKVREHALNPVRKQLERMCSQEHPLRREQLAELEKLAAANAVVLVRGDGGMGKSVLLRQWAAWRIEAAAEPAAAYTHVYPLDDGYVPTKHAGAYAAAQWCGLPSHTAMHGSQGHERYGEDMSDTLSRLEAACSARRDAATSPAAKPPWMCLVVDGWDEATTRRERCSEARALFDWYTTQVRKIGDGQEYPAATLVLTYRTDCERLQEWFRLGEAETWSASVPRGVGVLDVGPLTADDIRALVPELRACSGRPRRPEGPEEQGPNAALHREGLDAFPETLLHPVILCRFLDLGSAQRLSYLAGDGHQAADLLAERYVQWFCLKVMRRRFPDTRPNEADLLEALRKVARQTWGAGPSSGRQLVFTKAEGWDRSVPGMHIDGYKCGLLYEEAVQSGMIRPVRDAAPSWAWRHEFIWEWLAGEDH